MAEEEEGDNSVPKKNATDIDVPAEPEDEEAG